MLLLGRPRPTHCSPGSSKATNRQPHQPAPTSTASPAAPPPKAHRPGHGAGPRSRRARDDEPNQQVSLTFDMGGGREAAGGSCSLDERLGVASWHFIKPNPLNDH